MSTLLDDINSLDRVINSLVKMESKMRSGQFIEAHREVCRLAGILEKHKQDLIAAESSKMEKKNDQ